MPRFTLALVVLLVSVAPLAAQETAFLEETAEIDLPDDVIFAAPFGINNQGHVVGTAPAADERDRAFVWTPRTGFEFIAQDAIAWDINDRGEVVGQTVGSNPTGFLWTRRNGFTDLGAIVPFAINNKGGVAGGCAQNPCVRENGALRILSTVQGSAFGINDRGDVVGQTFDERGFLWTREGEIIDLGIGFAADINNRGLIAGDRVIDANRFATVWTRDGRVLASLPQSSSIEINERGLVAVNAAQPFVWNPRTGRRLELRSSRGGAVLLFESSERYVVGNVEIAGTIHVLIWRIRPSQIR